MYEMLTMTHGDGRVSGKIEYYIEENNAKNTNKNRGGVYVPTEKSTTAMGEPVPGAEVFLELEPDEQPIANTETDSTGNYGFANVGANSYSIRVEIPGFPMISTYAIDVTDEDTLFIDRIFYVDTTASDGWIDTLGNDSSSFVASFVNENVNMKLYPNPFVENIKFEYNLTKQNNVAIDIYDVLGNKIETLINDKQMEGEYSYTFKAKSYNLNSGTYLVRFTVGNITYLKKIMMIE